MQTVSITENKAKTAVTLPLPRIEIFSVTEEGETKFMLALVNHKNRRADGPHSFNNKKDWVRAAVEFKEFLDWPIIKILTN